MRLNGSYIYAWSHFSYDYGAIIKPYYTVLCLCIFIRISFHFHFHSFIFFSFIYLIFCSVSSGFTLLYLLCMYAVFLFIFTKRPKKKHEICVKWQAFKEEKRNDAFTKCQKKSKQVLHERARAHSLTTWT